MGVRSKLRGSTVENMKLPILISIFVALGEASYLTDVNRQMFEIEDKLNQEIWIKSRNSNDSLYDEVCKTGDNGSVDWTGMAKGIIVAVLPLTPLGAITNLAAILSVMNTVSGSWNAGSDEMEKANACAKLMINEAIDAEIFAEVKDASGDIAEALGELQTLLNNTGDSISDLKISVALTKYERIREMKDVIGRRFTNVDSSKLEKHQEKLVYFYTSALSIQASAALTIQATAEAKASIDSASLTRDTFTQDIQTIMGSEYGNSGDRSIQGIFDKSPFKTQWMGKVTQSKKCDPSSFPIILHCPAWCHVDDGYRGLTKIDNYECQSTAGGFTRYCRCSDLAEDCGNKCDNKEKEVKARVTSQMDSMDEKIREGKDFMQHALDKLKDKSYL